MKLPFYSRFARLIRPYRQKCFIFALLLLIMASAYMTSSFTQDSSRNRRYSSQFVEVGGNHEAVLHRQLHKLKTLIYDWDETKQYTATNITSMPPVQFLPGIKNPCFLANEHIKYIEDGKRKRGSRISLRCVPYFLLAGFQKCGTSDIYDRIRVHPDVLDSSFYKEPHFWKRDLPFSNYTTLFKNGPAEIMRRSGGIVELLKKIPKPSLGKSYNPDLKSAKHSYSSLIQGDFSATNSILSVDRLQSLHKTFPHTKIILMLRDPSDRAFSHYVMDVRYGYIKGQRNQAGFHKAMKKTIGCLKTKKKIDVYKTNCPGDWVLTAGMYIEFIQNWLKVFPKKNILFVQFEEYIQDPGKVIHEEVVPFLGLAPMDDNEIAYANSLPVNNPTSADFQMYSSTRIMLDDFFEPYNNRLAETLKEDKFEWP